MPLYLSTSALFNILRDSTIELRALDGKALDAQFKYAELVMKVSDMVELRRP